MKEIIILTEMRVEYTPVSTIDGETIGTEELNNSPVILSVMAEWCPSCRAEAVELQKAYEVYKDKGILFLSLFIRSSDKGIKKFIRRNGVTFPVGKDNGMARKLGVWGIPVTFLIAKDGKIKKRYFGRINQPAIRQGIEEIQE
jgi:cytochrome c biogenesis protein CcmG/thiol:disulfide interchange protein DsbE